MSVTTSKNETKKWFSNECTRLVGQDLLNKLNDLTELPLEEKAFQCGYYSSKNKNEKGLHYRLHLTAFKNALLKALDVELDPHSTKEVKFKDSSDNIQGIKVRKTRKVRDDISYVGKGYRNVRYVKPTDKGQLVLRKYHANFNPSSVYEVKQRGNKMILTLVTA